MELLEDMREYHQDFGVGNDFIKAIKNSLRENIIDKLVH